MAPNTTPSRCYKVPSVGRPRVIDPGMPQAPAEAAGDVGDEEAEEALESGEQAHGSRAEERQPWHDDRRQFFRELPKVELHAHLSGCVRVETILAILMDNEQRCAASEQRQPVRWKPEWDVLTKMQTRSTKICFDIFRLIHSALVSRDAIRRVGFVSS